MIKRYSSLLFIFFLVSVVVTGAAGLLENNIKSITAIIPNATISEDQTFCLNEANASVTLTGAGGLGSGFYTFEYEVNGSPDSISTATGQDSITINYDTSNINTTTYRITSVTFNNGSPVAVNDQQAVLRTEAPPVADFTFINDQCSGSPVPFINGGTSGLGVSYVWDFGDGNSSTERNPVHVYDALGCGTRVFDVTLEVTRNGCTDTITKQITINEAPELSLIDVDNPFDPFNNCSSVFSSPNYTITIDDTSPATCVSNKRIDWGDGTIETNPTFPLSHTYTTTGAFNLRILGDGDNGCTGERVYVVKNVSNPQGGLNSPGTTQNLCAPTPDLNFAISNWGANSADTRYTIDYGDGSPAVVYTQTELEASAFYNSSNPSSSAPFPVPYSYLESNCPMPSYTVRLNIQNACGFTEFTASNITVLSPPEALFEAPEEACVNTPVTFTNLSGAGYGRNCNTDAIYTWDFGDGSPVITTAPSPPLNIDHTYTAPGTYTVRLTAQGFCDDDVYEETICIEPPVVPSISYSTIEGCENIDVAVTNTTDLTGFCSDVFYNWTIDYADDFCANGTGSYSFINGTDASSVEPEFNFAEPGRYTISGTITGSSCGTVPIPAQEILVKQPPRVTINPINDVCEDDGLTINPTAMVNSCALPGSNLNYSWSFPGAATTTSNEANPRDITYAGPGDYTVSLTVTNECGSTAAADVTFSISANPVITGNFSECEGETEQLFATGIPASSRPWRSSDNSVARINNRGLVRAISPGTAQITFTNSNGCENTIDFEVRNGPSFTSQPLPNQELCVDAPASTLSATFSNGSGTVTYQWYENTVDDNSTGTAISGATSASYTPVTDTASERFYYVIVSFSEGCDSITSNTARVLVNPQPVIDTQPIALQEVCVGSRGLPLSLDISNTPGNASYQWFENSIGSNSGGTAITGATGQSYTPPVFNTSGSYFYYVEAIFSTNGCSTVKSDVAEIQVIADPVIDVQPIVSQEICQGSTATSLSVTASGGKGSFSYQWYQSSTNTNTGGSPINGATSNTYEPLTDSTGDQYYYVVATQPGLDCEVRSNTSLVSVVPSPFISSQPQSATYCVGDSISTLTVGTSNGTGVPSYQWFENTVNSNAGGIAIAGANASTFNPPSALQTAYYYVQVSFNSGGCSTIMSDVATITIDQGPVISDESLTICSGEDFQFTPQDNEVNIIPEGTTYTWSVTSTAPANAITGFTDQSSPQSSINQQLINTTDAVASIVYTVTPTSGNCDGVPFSLNVEVLPRPIVIFDQPDQLICNASTTSAVFLSSSSTNNINYNWTANVPDGISGVIEQGTDQIPPQTLINNTDQPLTVTYTATATLDNASQSCTGTTATYSITVSPSISATGTVTDYNGFGVSSFGAADGAINLSVSGGSNSFTYDWTGPNGFTATSQDIGRLAAGTYQVSISDGVCPPIVLEFIVTEPANLTIAEINDDRINVSCADGSDGALTVAISQQSIGPYLFELLDSSSNIIDSSASTTDIEYTFEDLPAGIYSVRVTDSNGSSRLISGLEIVQPSPIIIDLAVSQVSCYLANDATITSTVTGGTGTYTVTWNDLAVGFSRDNLAPGTYTITVTDENGCSATKTVVINQPPVFFTEPVVGNISCTGANDGFIQLNLNGGVAPVNLVWSDGSDQGTTRNNLRPGTYTATIKDATGCSIVESFTIIEPQPIILDANVSPVVDCNNPNSGAIDLLVSGGTAPFTFTWNTGDTTEDLNNITAGSYQVNVVDASGCTASTKIDVTGTTPIKLQLNDRVEVDCEIGVSEQFITATAVGGVAPYTFQWSSGRVQIPTEPTIGTNSDTISTTLNGLVIVTVTDAVGCRRQATFDVDLETLDTPSFDSDSFAYFTYGEYSILDPIQFTNTSQGTPLEVTWDFGDGSFSNELSPTHTYTSPGQYVVTQSVDYGYGCIQKTIITLDVTIGYKLIVPNAFTPNGDGVNDVFRPVQEGLEDLSFSVYDSWGSLIYSEEGLTISGWNGEMNNRNTENGNFYYKLIGKTFYGTEVVSEGAFTKID